MINTLKRNTMKKPGSLAIGKPTRRSNTILKKEPTREGTIDRNSINLKVEGRQKNIIPKKKLMSKEAPEVAEEAEVEGIEVTPTNTPTMMKLLNVRNFNALNNLLDSETKSYQSYKGEKKQYDDYNKGYGRGYKQGGKYE